MSFYPRPFFKKTDTSNPPATRFLILFVRGSGSTLLAELLNQVPGFLCLREPKLRERFFDLENIGELKRLQRADDRKHRALQTNRIESCRWIGAKVKLYDQLPKKLREYVIIQRVKTIILTRKDVGRHAIGLCRKNLAKHSVVWNSADRLENSEIRLSDLSATVDWIIKRNQELEAYASSINRENCYFVDYANLCESREYEVRRICEFVTNESFPEMPPLDKIPVKHTSHSWWDDISNAEAVKQYLASRNLLYP